MKDFKLITQASGDATWCDGELHVRLANLRDVHDFRGATLVASMCDCKKAEEPPSE